MRKILGKILLSLRWLCERLSARDQGLSQGRGRESVLRAKEEDENAQLLSLLNGESRLGMLYTFGISLLFLLLAVVSRVGSLEATDDVQTGWGILTLGINS